MRVSSSCWHMDPKRVVFFIQTLFCITRLYLGKRKMHTKALITMNQTIATKLLLYFIEYIV